MTTLTQRLLSGALMITTGFEIGCKSEHPKPVDIYGATTVASSDAKVQPAKATPGLGKSWIIPTEFSDTITSPLTYADKVAQDQGNDARMIETAHIVQSMAKLSEDLDHTLSDRNNTNPTATRRLEAAAKDFKKATHYVEHPNYGRSSWCPGPLVDSPSKIDPAVTLACSIRGVALTATGDIVMKDANLFQTQGLKAAPKINHDFDAFRSFQERAEKIEGISHRL